LIIILFKWHNCNRH